MIFFYFWPLGIKLDSRDLSNIYRKKNFSKKNSKKKIINFLDRFFIFGHQSPNLIRKSKNMFKLFRS